MTRAFDGNAFKWYIDTDLTVEITVTDEDGSAVDLSSATEIELYITETIGGTKLVEKKKSNGATEWAWTSDGTDGKYKIYLGASDNTDFDRKTYFYDSDVTISSKVGKVIRDNVFVL